MNFFLSITELYCINYCCTAKWLSYTYKVKVKVKSLKSRQTLCDPMDCSPPGSSIHGILQARTLEWVAISFSRGSSWPRDRTRVSRVVGRCFTIWATREVHTYIWVYIYIYTSFFIFFSIMVCHRNLNIVSRAIQEDLVVYPFYACQFASADPRCPLHPSTRALPFGNHQFVFSVPDSVSVS